jgi:hypothetical protein
MLAASLWVGEGNRQEKIRNLLCIGQGLEREHKGYSREEMYARVRHTPKVRVKKFL